jgi:hypothetical protein
MELKKNPRHQYSNNPLLQSPHVDMNCLLALYRLE